MGEPSVAVRLEDWWRSVRTVPVGMSDAELRSRAGVIWSTIDEDGEGPRRPLETRAKSSRLYYVARDIQRARQNGSGEVSVYQIVAFLATVLLNSSRPRVTR